MSRDNPFYQTPYHPDFENMTPRKAGEAIRKLLTEAEAAIDSLEKNHQPCWESLIVPLHDAQRQLNLTWGLLHHMLSVVNNPQWRTIEDELQPEIVRFSQRVGQSSEFYKGYLAIRAEEFKSLTGVQQRILEKLIRAAEQSGVALDADHKQEFNRIQTELANLSTKFNNNLLDARKAYSMMLTTPAEAEGMPADLRSITAAQARSAGDADDATAAAGPWRVTLDYAVYAPFMKHSRNRAARASLYRANVTLASTGETDNQPLIERILKLKRREAQLLGFKNAAELSLSNKMAGSVNNVYRLFERLENVVAPVAAEDESDLLKFAQANGFNEDHLKPWDISFWSERLREKRYGYSEEQLSAYFKFPRVLQGMFELTERIFAIKITDHTGEVPVWHQDVRFYRVVDIEGAPLACFYLDPYSRPETKRGGAWMNEFRTREKLTEGTVQLPMAVMCCNQSVPIDDKPSLMRMDEVTTLFHEFGHALQHMLTEVNEPLASGINGIEWDAVEIASQFMENWCYDRRTLQSVSEHAETGAQLPDSLFKKIVNSRNHRAAGAMMRQLFLGATDMDLYARYPNPKWRTPDDVKRENAARYHFPIIQDDRFLCSFAHIFGGGYSAGYYSYKWSEVLSADCFAAFEECNMQDTAALRETGLRMRRTIMGMGGGTPPLEVFKAFRGREPDTEALLRHCGLLSSSR